MKITRQKKVDDVIEVSAVASPRDVERALAAAKLAFAQRMGLRPTEGATIDEAAREKLGIRDLTAIVQKDAVNGLGPLVLDKVGVIPAFLPTVTAEGAPMPGREFPFEVRITPKPTYELTSYEPVEVTVVPFSVDEAVVNEELEGMLSRFTQYIDVIEPPEGYRLKKGDCAKIAIKAFKDGREMKGLTTDGRPYSLGIGAMPDGFDENVEGMAIGETKSFTFTGPGFDENFNPVEEVVEAEVTVLALQEEKNAELTDEWVRTNMRPYTSAEELRASVRERVEARMRPSYDDYVGQRVGAEWAKRFKGRIADEVYEAMQSQLLMNMRMDVQQQGQSWEEFVKQNGGESQFGMMLLMQARDIIALGYALDAVFDHFGLTVTDEDLDAACRRMNPRANPKTLRTQLTEAGQGFVLREMAERSRANRFVVENAHITYDEN